MIAKAKKKKRRIPKNNHEFNSDKIPHLLDEKIVHDELTDLSDFEYWERMKPYDYSKRKLHDGIEDDDFVVRLYEKGL